jgi:hypothetical protein
LRNTDISSVAVLPNDTSPTIYPHVFLAKFIRTRRKQHNTPISLTVYSICFTRHYPQLTTTTPLSLPALRHCSPRCCIDYPRNREGIG